MSLEIINKKTLCCHLDVTDPTPIICAHSFYDFEIRGLFVDIDLFIYCTGSILIFSLNLSRPFRKHWQTISWCILERNSDCWNQIEMGTSPSTTSKWLSFASLLNLLVFLWWTKISVFCVRGLSFHQHSLLTKGRTHTHTLIHFFFFLPVHIYVSVFFPVESLCKLLWLLTIDRY
jgi:hypothetical protein